MLRTATRRAMLYPSAAAAAAGDWWTWLDANYTVAGAYDFRSAASLADATKIGSTPSIVTQPGGGLNITAAGLVCLDDTALNTGITVSSNTSGSFVVCHVNTDLVGNNFGTNWFGIYGGATNKRLQIDSGAVSITGYSFGNGGIVNAGTRATSGTVGISASNAYEDGIWVAEIPAGVVHSDNCFIAALNVASSALYHLKDSTIAAFAITSDTISEADMATLHTLMSA